MLMPKQVSTPLYLEQHGQGRDVVLLHGWGLHGGVWQPLLTELETQYRLHVIDLPGHGYSEFGREGFDLDSAAEAVSQTMNACGLSGIVLLGWSLGGMIGWRMAIRDPGLVSRMVLVATAPSFVRREHWPYGMSVDELNVFSNQLQQDYRATVLRFLALQAQGDERARENVRALRQIVFERGEPGVGALAAGLEILRSADLTAGLAETVQPTLLIGGQRDVLVSPDALEAAANRLSAARVHIIRGAGHAPFLSHDDEFVRHARDFIDHAD